MVANDALRPSGGQVRLVTQARLVAGGGAVGALSRFALSEAVPGVGTTLAVNVVGSLLIGWLAARHRRTARWILIGVGFCGGLTSFSTFALDVATALEEGALAESLSLILITTVAAAGAAFTGFSLGSRPLGRRP